MNFCQWPTKNVDISGKCCNSFGIPADRMKGFLKQTITAKREKLPPENFHAIRCKNRRSPQGLATFVYTLKISQELFKCPWNQYFKFKPGSTGSIDASPSKGHNVSRSVTTHFFYGSGNLAETLGLTLSPARILNESITCSAVSVSATSRVMKSTKAWNVTLPVSFGSTMAIRRLKSSSPYTNEENITKTQEIRFLQLLLILRTCMHKKGINQWVSFAYSNWDKQVMGNEIH